jgi:hypothetical protein
MMLLPTVELVPGNLSQLQTLTWDAQPKWFNLGLALGIDETKLKAIEVDHHEVERRFTEVLSVWLCMSTPQRSWERLITALEQPAVGLLGLSKSIRNMAIGVAEAASLTTEDAVGIVTSDSHAGQSACSL